MPLFKRKSPEEVLKQNQRALNRVIRSVCVLLVYAPIQVLGVTQRFSYYYRELDRERGKLETQEKKIIADIKKMAKTGQMVGIRRHCHGNTFMCVRLSVAEMHMLRDM